MKVLVLIVLFLAACKPDGPSEIVAEIAWTDKPSVTTEVMQECGIAWKEGSATELERWCVDRQFPTRRDANLALKEARESFEKDKPANVRKWRIYVRPSKKERAS